jgi:hypothetical protein
MDETTKVYLTYVPYIRQIGWNHKVHCTHVSYTKHCTRMDETKKVYLTRVKHRIISYFKWMKPQSSPDTCHTLPILCTKMDEITKFTAHVSYTKHTLH